VPRFSSKRFELRTCDGVKAPLGGVPHEDADDDPEPKSALVGCMVGNPTNGRHKRKTLFNGMQVTLHPFIRFT
jgi:hypothetical protein